MSRGITAVQLEGELLDSEKSGIIPLYIGSAPYWQVGTANWAEKAGQSFVINDIDDAREKIGYYEPTSGAWPKEFSLCEAVYAHFELKKVGPIIVILNEAEVSVSETEQSSNVTLVNGIGSIAVNGLAILSSVSIDGKTKGVDYSVYYTEDGHDLVIKDLKKAFTEAVAVKYNVVENLSSLIMTSDTFEAIDYLEQTVGEIPSLIAAPGWEDELLDGTGTKTVASKLIDIATSTINRHWYTQAYVQLTSSTRTNVATEKSSKGYDSPKLKACWPFCKKNNRVIKLVIKWITAKMIVDIANDNIPYESASNEILDIEGLCDASGNIIKQKESDANALNEIGVATCNFVSGAWRSWGVCMSNYLESNKENILPEYLNDVAVQMRDYVSNDFQKENFDSIDKPIPTKKAKEIVGDYQVILNNLVSIGALLFGTIEFTAASNPISALANGDFVFNLAETSTPPGKSITLKVRYSPEGLSTYNSEEA